MATSTEGIIISDVCLTKPSQRWKLNPEFQIVIKYGSEARASKFEKGDSCITWDESFFLAGEVTEHNRLTFTVHKKRFPKGITADSCDRRVIDLLEMQNSSGTCKLDIAGKCQLTFKIEKSTDVVLEAVQQATDGSGNLRNLEVSTEAAIFITSTVQVYSDNEKTWSSFLDKFEVFMGVIDEISEISPYVKVAWSILSVIPKTIIAKKKRDDKIKQLCDKLEDVYNYITDAKRLPELTKTQSKTLTSVVRQTTECAYFIRAYCTEDIVRNTLKGIMGSVDHKIQDFNDTFDRLMEVMKNSVNLETSIVTLRVKECVDKLDLKDMLYSGSYPEPGKQCLPGTRKRVPSKVVRFKNNRPVQGSPQTVGTLDPCHIVSFCLAEHDM